MAELFNIHLESDLSEWTSTVTDGGDLSWSNDATAQAVASTSGAMKLVIDDTNTIYGRKTVSAITTGKARLRFYFDPNSVSMGTTGATVLLVFENSIGNYLGYVRFKNDGGYQVHVRVYNDAGGASDGTYYAITDEPHYIEVYYFQATTADANDGGFSLWIDGTLKQTVNTIDLYTRFSSYGAFSLGLPISIPAGTSGTIYLDEFAVNDDGSEIGPVGAAATSLVPRRTKTYLRM